MRGLARDCARKAQHCLSESSFGRGASGTRKLERREREKERGNERGGVRLSLKADTRRKAEKQKGVQVEVETEGNRKTVEVS